MYLEKTVFWKITSLIVVLFGALFTCALGIASDANEKVEKNNTTYVEIQSRLQGIETNLEWIKAELKN